MHRMIVTLVIPLAFLSPALGQQPWRADGLWGRADVARSGGVAGVRVEVGRGCDMPYLIRIGRSNVNRGGFTCKGYCIWRSGTNVHVEWGAIEMVGGRGGQPWALL